LAHAYEYESLADFFHDEILQCEHCARRWYRAPAATFDEEAWRAEGIWICAGCAWGSPGWAGVQGHLEMAREHGTLWAHKGAVVG
jgi:hypothetical protein